MNKLLIYPLILLLSIESFAQESVQRDSSIVTVDESESSLLFLGLSYASNNMKNQNFSETELPSITGDVSYYHKNGFYSTFVYTNYIEADATYETELQLGYEHSFFDMLSLDFYYGWHQFQGDTDYESLNYDHTLNLTSTLLYEFLQFSVDQSVTFGNSDNFFLDLDAGFSIDLENIIFQDDLLNFGPFVSFSFGTDYWIYDPMSDHHKRTVINFLNRRNFNTSTFEFQSTNFYLPIIYTTGNVSFAFSWLYSIPSEKFKTLNWDDQYAVMLSFIYSPNF